MERLAEILKHYAEENPPVYGDAETVLDVLYWHYMEYGGPDSEKVRNQFEELRKLVNFPPEDYDRVFYLVSDLCLEHGRLAFREGIKVGMVLSQELQSR